MKKTSLILKIVISVLAVAIVGMVVLFLVELYAKDTLSYFTKHFAIFFILLFIGSIALLLPNVNRRKFSENKGESMMVLVGFLLIICAVISIIVSYMG